jgi:phosphoribosylformylglycinamidine (FGAM) synthase PurS component
LLKSVEVQQFLNTTQQNLNRDLRTMFTEDAVKAYKVLVDIMEKPEALDKDRLVAARDLLDRAGYKAIDRVITDTQATVTVDKRVEDLPDDELEAIANGSG